MRLHRRRNDRIRSVEISVAVIEILCQCEKAD